MMLAGIAGGAPAAETPSYQKDLLPLLQEYCWDCHGDGAKKGGLSLDGYQTSDDLLKDRKVWEGVMYHLEQSLMPPANRDQPEPEARAQMVKWIDDAVFPVDPAHPDPGRVTVRRLNKTEYNHTTRDLLGVDLRLADAFPDDDSGYGFDNIGDVLSMPPVLVERYLEAAERLLDVAVVSPAATPQRERLEMRSFYVEPREAGARRDQRVELATVGEAKTWHDFPIEADYTLRLRAWADQAGDEPAKLIVLVDDQEVQTIEVTGTAERPQPCEVRFRARQGRSALGFAFPNDFWDGQADRNLYFSQVELAGPIWTNESPVPETHRRLFIQEPGTEGTDAATRQVLTAFANRAYRRPARSEEIDKLVALARRVQAGGATWEESVKAGCKAVLVSPFFLYRIEWQPEPDNPAQVVDLGEFALASRLSYFLWSSMPDDRLLSLAARNELRANLTGEIRRMIADPKARALAENFGGQWLEIRNLAIAQPNRRIFNRFNDRLRRAMREETETFFHHVLTENRPVLDFLGADYTFANEQLAEFYGLEGVQGQEFRKVSLDTRRRGILTHASVLTVTSDTSRTSPIKRGKWVLDNLLGTPPPPPPPDVPSLESAKELTGTLRQRLEQHRSNASCANCHAMLDPLGFGLENFDAIGAWRDRDGDAPIDSTGRLSSGQEFQNAAELANVLLRDKADQFTRTLASKLLTFALGRGVEYYDKTALNEIVAKTKDGDYAFHTLIQAVCESVPFQKRRGNALH